MYPITSSTTTTIDLCFCNLQRKQEYPKPALKRISSNSNILMHASSKGGSNKDASEPSYTTTLQVNSPLS
ncbi:hypothetical protein GQ44DRAFT_717630 [Phaeosphaeriaceae sp. PMI808]|nr:hypothetical protein GQ44DRAFT_717630 [Phaeosphaeriaceae sp. PMI808]